MIGERGITLSGGQRQRVAIARALVVDPRVLILDDATASVDATTEARIREGLREAMRDRTTVIIAHRLSTIALADEIVVIEDGRIAARGGPDELLGTNEVYREIYEHGRFERAVASRRSHEVWRPGARSSRRGTSGRRPVMGRHERRLTALYRLARPYRLRTALSVVSLLAATAASSRRRSSSASRSTTCGQATPAR